MSRSRKRLRLLAATGAELRSQGRSLHISTSLDVEELVAAQERLAETLPRGQPGVLRLASLLRRELLVAAEEVCHILHFIGSRVATERQPVAERNAICVIPFFQQPLRQVKRLIAYKGVVHEEQRLRG